MNVLLQATLGISSLTFYAYIHAMDSTSNQDRILVERTLNIIAIYNVRNSHETAIDKDKYLCWLMQKTPPNNTNEELQKLFEEYNQNLGQKTD